MWKITYIKMIALSMIEALLHMFMELASLKEASV